MPRGGIRKKKKSVAVQERCRSVPRGAPSRSLFAPFPRSLLLNRTEMLATRAMADRESSIALCHGMELKKKGSVEDRESGVALCHGMTLKKEGSVEDRESGVALCHKVALKKRERERDRSRTERTVSLSATGWR